MAASALSNLVKGDKETKVNLDQINGTLDKMYKLQLKVAKDEGAHRKKLKQDEKRKSGDRLGDILKDNNKDKDKINKNFMKSLTGAFKGLGGLLAKGLGTALGKLGLGGIISAALGKVGLGAMLKAAFTKGFAFLGTAVFWKGLGIAAAIAAAVKGVTSLGDKVDTQTYGLGKTKKGSGFTQGDLKKLMQRVLDNEKLSQNDKVKIQGAKNSLTDRMKKTKSLNDQLYNARNTQDRNTQAFKDFEEHHGASMEDIAKGKFKSRPGLSRTGRGAAINRAKGLIKERDETPNKIKQLEKNLDLSKKEQAKLTTAFFEEQKVKFSEEDLIQVQVKAGRRLMSEIPSHVDKSKIEDRNALGHLYHAYSPINYGAVERRATGGPIRVPGAGSGDKIPMMLPSGSFVLNREASRFQSGGMVPTLLEPGENVYGPGQWGAHHMMMNSAIPRFQTGGEVKRHPYLDKLSDNNIVKANAAPGLCVTGSLNTMQQSGVPNPAGTGSDKGNNPRGGAVQLINNYGWGSIPGGTNTTLQSPYGSSNVSVFDKSGYDSQVSKGNVPSGAIVFQTKHDDWNGTSAGSRGYDMAIAQQGGRQHWNGQSMPQNVYGGQTKQIIALTPGGKAGGGMPGKTNPNGGGSNGIFSSVAGISGAVGEFFGVVTGAIQEVFGDSMGSLFGGVTGPGTSSYTGGGTDKGVDVAKSLVTDMRISAAAASGIVGNLLHESGMNPAEREGPPYGAKEKPWSKGTIGKGYGWAQWTNSAPGDRLDKFIDHIGGQNNIATNKQNYDFLLKEFRGPEPIKGIPQDDPSKAAKWFRSEWERAGIAHDGPRTNYAKQVYEQMQPQKKQTGGAVHMNSTASGSSLAKQSENNFIDKMASSMSPVVIPVPSGGGGAPQGAVNPGTQTSPPTLSANPSNTAALDLAYRLSMGASFS